MTLSAPAQVQNRIDGLWIRFCFAYSYTQLARPCTNTFRLHFVELEDSVSRLVIHRECISVRYFFFCIFKYQFKIEWEAATLWVIYFQGKFPINFFQAKRSDPHSKSTLRRMRSFPSQYMKQGNSQYANFIRVTNQ